MSEQSIKVNIAGRHYPITVKGDEEKSIRDAEKKINEGIEKLRSRYSVTDKQDLLAMVSLQLIAQQKVETSPEIIKDIEEIENLLSAHLSK